MHRGPDLINQSPHRAHAGSIRMKLTRVDTAALKTTTDQGAKALKELTAALAPYTVVLSEVERKRTLRAPQGFADAGVKLARGIADFPDVAAVVRYDAEAVLEDLDNVAALEKLVPVLAELQQRVNDTLLSWNAEAYQQSLVAYSAAQGMERGRPELRTLVAPMAEVFESRRRGGGDPSGTPEG